MYFIPPDIERVFCTVKLQLVQVKDATGQMVYIDTQDCIDEVGNPIPIDILITMFREGLKTIEEIQSKYFPETLQGGQSDAPGDKD
jgi:hypothetical protein